MTEPWPDRFTPTSLSVQVENVSRSGGASLFGSEQVVASPAGRLVARASFVVRSPADVRAWRALMARLKGRANPVEFPLCDSGRPAGILLHTHFVEDPGLLTTFSDDTLFEEESGFAALALSAAINATLITVTCTPAPIAGMFLGIGGRAHIVTAVELVGTNTYSLEITPWLRAAYTAGTQITFGRVSCLMRLQSDLSGVMDLDLLRFGRPSLELVEYL